MTEPVSLWIVAIIQRFDEIKYDDGTLAGLTTHADPHRYIPVFETREAAEAWNKGEHQVFRIRATRCDDAD